MLNGFRVVWTLNETFLPHGGQAGVSRSRLHNPHAIVSLIVQDRTDHADAVIYSE